MQIPYRKPGKYAYTKPDPLLTEEKFRELEKKLVALKKKRPEAAKEVARLAELGDFSENVEYQLAKGRLRGINNSILRLEYQINHADIIKHTGMTDKVRVGSTVTVEHEGKTKTYQILGSSETDPAKGIISHNSPIGIALLDKKVGDTVQMGRPGSEVEYRVAKIG